MRKILWLSTISGLFILIALGVYLKTGAFDTTLEFQVRDATSKAWVWNFLAELQDRAVRGFYQSSGGLIVYRFTKLKSGTWEMSVRAPSYIERRVEVHIKRGRNVLPEAIEMRGYEIPDLQRFYVFAEPRGKDIVIELRPAGSDGRAIVNHPCLDLWIGCRVSVQMKDGVAVQEPTLEGSTYGGELFRGNVQWEWDPSPDRTFRYRARIKASEIEEHDAPYRVIDYLIIVPDPRVIEKEEINMILSAKADISDSEKLKSLLGSYHGRLSYFLYRTWNVPGAQSQP